MIHEIYSKKALHIEIKIILFTCNMGIALTCSSNSRIRSNDAAICSLMFYKYTGTRSE